MLITILSKILGFFREIFLSYYYGASSVSDAYLVSLTIPGVVFSFLGTALAIGFVPIYTRVIKCGEDVNIFVSNVINVFFAISTIIIILTFVFSDEIVAVFAPGFSAETKSLTVFFTEIFVFGIYASALIFVFTGFLQVNGSFVPATFAGIPFNAVVLLSIYFGYHYGSLYLIAGTLFAKLVEIIYLYPYLKRFGFCYTFYFDIFDRRIKDLFLFSIPLVLGVFVNQINILVDKSIASTLTVGGVSALNYSYHLNQFIIGVFAVSIGTVVFPGFSKLYENKEHDKLGQLLLNALGAVAFLVLPASVFFMVFSREIVEVVYGRGNFTGEAITLTKDALFYFSVGMLGFAYREVLARFFYSMHDSKTPATNAVVGVIFNITLSLLISPFLGVGGLALATSVSSVVTSLLLLTSLRKKFPSKFSYSLIVSPILKIGLISFLSILPPLVVLRYFKNRFWSAELDLILVGLIFSVAYIVFALVSRVDALVFFARKIFPAKYLKHLGGGFERD